MFNSIIALARKYKLVIKIICFTFCGQFGWRHGAECGYQWNRTNAYIRIKCLTNPSNAWCVRKDAYRLVRIKQETECGG